LTAEAESLWCRKGCYSRKWKTASVERWLGAGTNK